MQAEVHQVSIGEAAGGGGTKASAATPSSSSASLASAAAVGSVVVMPLSKGSSSSASQQQLVQLLMQQHSVVPPPLPLPPSALAPISASTSGGALLLGPASSSSSSSLASDARRHSHSSSSSSSHLPIPVSISGPTSISSASTPAAGPATSGGTAVSSVVGPTTSSASATSVGSGCGSSTSSSSAASEVPLAPQSAEPTAIVGGNAASSASSELSVVDFTTKQTQYLTTLINLQNVGKDVSLHCVPVTTRCMREDCTLDVKKSAYTVLSACKSLPFHCWKLLVPILVHDLNGDFPDLRRFALLFLQKLPLQLLVECEVKEMHIGHQSDPPELHILALTTLSRIIFAESFFYCNLTLHENWSYVINQVVQPVNDASLRLALQLVSRLFSESTGFYPSEEGVIDAMLPLKDCLKPVAAFVYSSLKPYVTNVLASVLKSPVSELHLQLYCLTYILEKLLEECNESIFNGTTPPLDREKIEDIIAEHYMGWVQSGVPVLVFYACNNLFPLAKLCPLHKQRWLTIALQAMLEPLTVPTLVKRTTEILIRCLVDVPQVHLVPLVVRLLTEILRFDSSLWRVKMLLQLFAQVIEVHSCINHLELFTQLFSDPSILSIMSAQSSEKKKGQQTDVPSRKFEFLLCLTKTVERLNPPPHWFATVTASCLSWEYKKHSHIMEAYFQVIDKIFCDICSKSPHGADPIIHNFVAHFFTQKQINSYTSFHLLCIICKFIDDTDIEAENRFWVQSLLEKVSLLVGLPPQGDSPSEETMSPLLQVESQLGISETAAAPEATVAPQPEPLLCLEVGLFCLQVLACRFASIRPAVTSVLDKAVSLCGEASTVERCTTLKSQILQMQGKNGSFTGRSAFDSPVFSHCNFGDDSIYLSTVKLVSNDISKKAQFLLDQQRLDQQEPVLLSGFGDILQIQAKVLTNINLRRLSIYLTVTNQQLFPVEGAELSIFTPPHCIPYLPPKYHNLEQLPVNESISVALPCLMPHCSTCYSFSLRMLSFAITSIEIKVTFPVTHRQDEELENSPNNPAVSLTPLLIDFASLLLPVNILPREYLNFCSQFPSSRVQHFSVLNCTPTVLQQTLTQIPLHNSLNLTGPASFKLGYSGVTIFDDFVGLTITTKFPPTQQSSSVSTSSSIPSSTAKDVAIQVQWTSSNTQAMSLLFSATPQFLSQFLGTTLCSIPAPCVCNP
ncbi:hypothetical protein Pelo_8496 [Pelomyxa schiedti]|nr:hypothetical protein Pelo_8496 [Pelomyxa schiedti]